MAERTPRKVGVSEHKPRASTAPLERHNRSRFSSSDDDEYMQDDADSCWLELREPSATPTAFVEDGLALRVSSLHDLNNSSRSLNAAAAIDARRSPVMLSGAPSSVGIANADLMHVPVSLVTPTSIAIVDPAFAADAAAVVRAARAASDRLQLRLISRRATVAEIQSPSDSEAPTLSLCGDVPLDGAMNKPTTKPRERLASLSPRERLASLSPRERLASSSPHTSRTSLMAEIKASSARRPSRHLTFSDDVFR